MTMEGRELALWERLVSATERSAAASEELIKLAREERIENVILPGLPVCPHCHMLNPTIRSEGGTGEFGDFVLVAECQNCKQTFLANPQGWDTFKDANEYTKLQEGRENVIST